MEGIDEGVQRGERVGVLQVVADELAGVVVEAVRVMQSLPEPSEAWASEAFLMGGFTHCGTLAYMRLGLNRTHARSNGEFEGPPDVRLRPVAGLGEERNWRSRMERALEASYVGSQDCPELWGMRETGDVLDSHLATGQWDPSLWWLIEHGDAPAGVALFNPLGDGVGCELVYVGLAPELRGKGLGARLIAIGTHACARQGLREMTCAVDRRNTPALRLYERWGFREFAEREAFVRRLDAV